MIHGRREMSEYSFVRASEVIGREVDKENVIDLLMKPDNWDWWLGKDNSCKAGL